MKRYRYLLPMDKDGHNIGISVLYRHCLFSLIKIVREEPSILLLRELMYFEVWVETDLDIFIVKSDLDLAIESRCIYITHFTSAVIPSLVMFNTGILNGFHSNILLQ